MMKKNTVGSGLLFLLIAGAVGYAIGLGLDALVLGTADPNLVGSIPSAFTLLFAVSAFFFGLYGYRGITRGLVWQVVGTLLGALFVTGIRALMGMESGQLFVTRFFFSEPAWVFGALVGVISFLAGVGVMDDWMKWARGIDTPEHHEDEPGYVYNHCIWRNAQGSG